NEGAFGVWLRQAGGREQLYIIGKGAHPAGHVARVTPAAITGDLFTSLTRVGCGWFDAYLLHRDDPAVPVDEIVDVLDGHRRKGLMTEYGGSNWSYGRIREANAWAAANGR